MIRTWYCRADLFLFPSTFDTNGLVVREAAACGLASVLVEGSCAAEDVTDGRNGFLIEENAESMAQMLRRLLPQPALTRQVGENAQRELYLSWEDSVARACARYEVVLDNFRRGMYPTHDNLADGFCGVRRSRWTPSTGSAASRSSCAPPWMRTCGNGRMRYWRGG